MTKRTTTRKSTAGRKSRAAAAPASTLESYRDTISENLSGVANANYRKMFSKASGKPAVRYVAGGIAAYALVKLAMRAFQAYPEIGTFFRDNLETVEDKLREFRGEFNEESTEARH